VRPALSQAELVRRDPVDELYQLDAAEEQRREQHGEQEPEHGSPVDVGDHDEHEGGGDVGRRCHGGLSNRRAGS
jgi:hypothetical protein